MAGELSQPSKALTGPGEVLYFSLHRGPAQHRPDVRSARPIRLLFHSTADSSILESTKMSLTPHKLWRRLFSSDSVRPSRSCSPQKSLLRLPLEELEARQTPASYAISAQLAISRLDNIGDAPSGTHAVVFFESNVTDYQVLRQGLGEGTDAVVLDSGGDGIKEIAAFLADRCELTAVGVVAHGAPGAVVLGTAMLNPATLVNYDRELATVGSALGKGGELDLWSCDVAAGTEGASLVRDVAVATGVGVAAADHAVGPAALGDNWQLNVRIEGASGEIPFDANAIGAFCQRLGAWSSAPSMSTGRIWHTSTLLLDGRVLVAAGAGTYSSSAELYTPDTGSGPGTWGSAASMATARYYPTGTLLNDGRVLVSGGQGTGGVYLSSAELYTPDSGSGSWSAAGSMSTGRYGQTATLLADGRVLVTGGKNGTTFLASAELYDPATNTWSLAGSMAVARYYHTATLLNNGKVLVTGGSNPSTLSSAELYDPATNTWSPANSMTAPRYGQTATLLSNGKLLVTGGVGTTGTQSSTELYDPAVGTWSSAGSMANPRVWATATLLTNAGSDQVLITGGASAVYKTELYNPATDTWSSAGFMAAARYGDAATLLNNGKVLISGGSDSSGNLASAELYSNVSVPAGSAVRFVLSGPYPTVAANTAFSITVTAVDANGNVATGYTGTVHFTDLASGSTLPADYTFSASESGVHTFTGLKCKKKGPASSHTITVVDTANSSIVGAWTFNVT
jgi:N-acetylneuraminic acid mutarotase